MIPPMSPADRRRVVLLAAEVGERYIRLLEARAKNNPSHDTRGRFARTGAGPHPRAHQSPRKVRGPEHATYLGHQAKGRREHARDIRRERRQMGREHATEEATLRRQGRRQAASLDRRQGRESARLDARHGRETAKAPDSRMLARRHAGERSELSAAHRQERNDLAGEIRSERRDLRDEHREAVRDQRHEHLEGIRDFRRGQRSDMAETLRDIRSQRQYERESRGESGKSWRDTADTKDRDDPENTYGLPEGDDIAKLLREFFGRQAAEVLGELPTIGEPLPDGLPDLEHWDERMGRAFTPLVSAYWDTAGGEVRERIGLEPDAWPDAWRVSDPNLREKIATASLNFCRSTNATTSLALGDALAALRRELTEGVVERGESVAELTKRVQGVFDGAEKYRARRIASTETSRAVHSAQYESVAGSGVVQGSEWLLSANACNLCHKIHDDVGRVKLGENFAVIGNNTDYKDIKFPPGHPGCRCSVTWITTPEFGGPEHPEWGETLVQPQVGDEHEPPAAARRPRATRPVPEAVQVVPEPGPTGGEPIGPKKG